MVGAPITNKRLFILYAQKIVACCILSSLWIFQLRSELFIVSVGPNGLVSPLSTQSINKKIQRTLYTTMMHYQWPTNTAYVLSGKTPEAQWQRFCSSTPDAEEEFIRTMIHQNLGPSFDVIFVPTVIYELFALQYFFEWQSPEFSKNVCHIMASFHEQDIRDAIEKSHVLSPVLDVFMKLFDDSAHHTQDAYLEINKQLGAYLIAMAPNSSAVTLDRFMQQNHLSITAKLVQKLMTSFTNDYVSHMQEVSGMKEIAENVCPFNFTTLADELEYDNQHNHDLATLKPTGILAKTLALEYAARAHNLGYIVRGTGTFQHILSLKDPLIKDAIDSTLTNSNVHSFAEFSEVLRTHQLPLHSISYGNTLFAGGVSDAGAMAYQYCYDSSNIGYALLINKKDYCFNQCNNLLFVSPLPTLVSLFLGGAYFHSRSKVAIAQSPEKMHSIDGIYGSQELEDKAGFLVVQRDPMDHEALFSTYLARNAQLIKPIQTIANSKEFKELAEKHFHIANVARNMHG